MWKLRIAIQAERDMEAALAHTLENFGTGQAAVYEALIAHALEELQRDPTQVACRNRPELHESARTLHLGKGARHFLLFRIVGGNTVEVARLLYDGMDLKAHVPQPYRPKKKKPPTTVR